MSIRSKWMIVIGVGCIGAIFIFAKYFYQRSSNEYTITLTETGFSPQDIAIHQGDTVRFVTTRDKEFWPASNVHPSHTIYPEFDPQQPIEANASWIFRFDKVGVWKFHDHLAPSYQGTITVVGGSVQKSSPCDSQSESTQCWEEQIDAVLKTKGLDDALSLMGQLYETEPAFASQCHSFSHTLGKAAYQLFAAHKDVALTPKTYYCGYGFYHGFMEALFQHTHDPEMAKQFCAYAGEKLKNQTSDAEGACYHGIGHGATDGGDPRTWGDPQAMIAPAEALCTTVTGASAVQYVGDYFYRCITGTYNALEILSQDPKYKLQSLSANPFAFCATQPASYREGCYTNMLPALMRLEAGDYAKAFAVIERVTEPNDAYDIRSWVITGLANELIHQNISDPAYIPKVLAMCRSLDSRAQLPCLRGLAVGHMKYGAPEHEYEKWLTFCGAPELNLDERSACYRYVLSRLRTWYSKEKSKEICEMTPVEYQGDCVYGD